MKKYDGKMKEIEKEIKQNNGKLNEEIYLKLNEIMKDDNDAIDTARMVLKEEKLVKVFQNIFERTLPYPNSDGSFVDWISYIYGL